jgi:hypothetical protein
MHFGGLMSHRFFGTLFCIGPLCARGQSAILAP